MNKGLIIPDFDIKLNLLLVLLDTTTKKIVDEGLDISRKTLDGWLRPGGKSISEKKLKVLCRFFEQVHFFPVPESIFYLQPPKVFLNEITCRYQDYFGGGKFLGHTQQGFKKNLNDIYNKYYKGYYILYCNWYKKDKGEKNLSPGVLKAFIDINNYFPETNRITVRCYSGEDKWDFKGWFFPTETAFTFIVERLNSASGEIITIVTNNPKNEKFDKLTGILTAPLNDYNGIPGMPAASRVVLQRVNIDSNELQDWLEKNIKFIKKEDLEKIKEQDHKTYEIIENIKNTITNDEAILLSHFF